jgi:hypothetical protein
VRVGFVGSATYALPAISIALAYRVQSESAAARRLREVAVEISSYFPQLGGVNK